MKKEIKKDQCGHQTKWYYYLYFLISLHFLFACCSSNNTIDFKNVEAVKFWYIFKNTEFNIPITNCGYIVRDTLINRDTIITDRTSIEQYITALNRLKPSKKPINYDLRVTSLIRFKDKREDLMVCISMYNGVVLIEDVIMKEDMRIVKLLDELLYNHLTEKDWTPAFLREE